MKKVTIPKVSLKNIRLSPIRGGDTVYKLEGKFTDNSTDSSYWYLANSEDGDRVNISAIVDPTTKKFVINNVKSTPFFTKNQELESAKITGNPGKVTTLIKMFSGCLNLGALDLQAFDTSKVTNMYKMFADCPNIKSINLSSFDTSNVQYMDLMFCDCHSLLSLDLSNFNTQKVKHIGRMFDSCYSLTELDLSNFDTSSLLSTFWTFMYCTRLTTLNLSGWDFSNLQEVTSMFDFCSSLSTVIGPITGIKLSLDLSNCPLTNESAMEFINGLESVSSTQTLKFSPYTFETLTQEQIAIATSKGWTIVKSSSGGIN